MIMKREEIERLLSLYYEGRTDERQEEALLQAIRAADDLPPALRRECDVFLSLHRAERDVVVPDGLEARLEVVIDRCAWRPCRRLWLRWGSVAATLLLAVGLGFGIAGMRQEPTPQDTFTNPEDAHRALEAILTEMSQVWSEGMEQLEDSQQDIMAANQEIWGEFSE